MGKTLIIKGADFSQNAIDDDKDYVLADSITFDGSHYINLGRGLTQQSKVEICFTPTVLATGGQIISVYGVRTGASLNQLDLRITYDNMFVINMVNDAATPGEVIYPSVARNTQYTVSSDIKNNKVTINGIIYANERTVTGFNTGNNNLYIGAYNSNGEIPSGFTLFTGKVHWIKIYDNDILANHYNAATVKATGVPCLVDRLHYENKYYLIS